MKPSGVCDAHNILYDNVTYLRKKQDETVIVVNEISQKQGEMSVTVNTILDTQAEILKMVKRRKWTPARVIALSAVLFGSGSAFPMLIAMFVKVAGK
jgi:hypothetical protein